MNVQLALDRMSIAEAVQMARSVREEVDWIEVGTSLIKEFGMESVAAIKREFPDKMVVADMKTFDNAKYEFELCFKAGADVATVMGAAPPVTLKACMDTAAEFGASVMIDLLHTSLDQRREIYRYKQAICCLHVSKDEQEQTGGVLRNRAHTEGVSLPQGVKLAVAGGITPDSLPDILKLNPCVVIVGSAITKAADPRQAASRIKQIIDWHKERWKDE